MSTFAEVTDLETRLGTTFAAAQTLQAQSLLELATGLVLDAISQDEAWLDAQTAIPSRLRVTCIEAAVRVFSNPTGARSESETLGAYSHSQSWADASAGMQLTEREERACRRAVYGSATASPRVGAIIDETLVRANYAPGATEWLDEDTAS
jgi:hypothetical protein